MLLIHSKEVISYLFAIIITLQTKAGKFKKISSFTLSTLTREKTKTALFIFS